MIRIGPPRQPVLVQQHGLQTCALGRRFMIENPTLVWMRWQRERFEGRRKDLTPSARRKCGGTSEKDRGICPKDLAAQRKSTGQAAPGMRAVWPVVVAWCCLVAVEVEQLEQVADCRTVRWNVGAAGRDRVGEIIPAAGGYRRQTPVPLDKLEDGDVIGVVVRDFS